MITDGGQFCSTGVLITAEDRSRLNALYFSQGIDKNDTLAKLTYLDNRYGPSNQGPREEDSEDTLIQKLDANEITAVLEGAIPYTFGKAEDHIS